jgi:CubicO group peptidase (beta-lactamase class C family)
MKKWKTPGTLFLLLLMIPLMGCGSEETGPQFGPHSHPPEYWPTDDWRSIDAAEVGMDAVGLQQVYDYVANPNINVQGFVVIRNGYIVCEGYFGKFDMNSTHESFSAAKSFTSALIGIAIEKGYLSGVDETIGTFFPQLNEPGMDEAKKEITIKHLLTMTSGLEWNEDDYLDLFRNDAIGMLFNPDLIRYVLDKPLLYAPGEHWYYSTGDSMLLSGVIQNATDMTAYQFALEHLLRPIGLSQIRWLQVRPGYTHGGMGIQATVREFAKFGHLYLKKGRWDSRQVVPESWVEESLAPVRSFSNGEVISNEYGYQWWLLPSLIGYEHSIVPPSTFLAWGIFSQQIFIVPEEDIVAVRVGWDIYSQTDEWDEIEFLTLILKAITE